LNVQTADKQWYRQPWAWLVAAPLVLVFIVCAILVTVAVRYGDDVVSDDYYKEGKMVNKHFAAESAAVDMGLVANITLDRNEKFFELSLTEPLSSNEKIVLKLSHPAQAELDSDFRLRRVALTTYRTETLGSIPSGRWYVRLEGYSSSNAALAWRLSGETNFTESPSIQLQ